jgi:hypothetical protein
MTPIRGSQISFNSRFAGPTLASLFHRCLARVAALEKQLTVVVVMAPFAIAALATLAALAAA